jgi:hypothetical protein
MWLGKGIVEDYSINSFGAEGEKAKEHVPASTG